MFSTPLRTEEKHESFRFPRLFKVVAPLNGLRKLQAGRGSVQKTAGVCAAIVATIVTACAGPDASTPTGDPPIWNVPAWVNQEFGTFKDAGVKPFVTYYGVFQGNPVGGLDQSAAWSQELIFGATLDLDQLFKLPGASLVISGADAAGSNLSDDIGNIFTASQAYVTPTMMFYELYWQQSLLDNALQFRLGRIAAGDNLCRAPGLRPSSQWRHQW